MIKNELSNALFTRKTGNVPPVFPCISIQLFLKREKNEKLPHIYLIYHLKSKPTGFCAISSSDKALILQ